MNVPKKSLCLVDRFLILDAHNDSLILRQVRDAPRPRVRPGAAWDVVAFKFGGVPRHRVFSRVPNLLNRCGL